MESLGDLCRRLSALTPTRINILENMIPLLGLASDIAHAQITLYVRVGKKRQLVLVEQARPRTSVVGHRQSPLGTLLPAAEEPLVWRTLETGDKISGQREWALGMDPLLMQTFPVREEQGGFFAVVSFEMSPEDNVSDNNVLVETAYDLLTSRLDPAYIAAYRPLSAQDGIIVVNERGQIVFANAGAAGIFRTIGVGRIIGRRVHERALNLRLAQKAASSGQPAEMEVETGGLVLAARALPVTHSGKTSRTIIVLADVTQLRKKEKELLVKSAVIQEIHHRVKNNLQTIASLLRLQARRTEFPEVKAALRESVNRILSISIVHEFLSQQDKELINVAEVAANILDLVIQSMVETGVEIHKVFESENVILPSEKASSLALAVNELVQNAIEHGLAGRRKGTIGVSISTTDDDYRLEVYDDGAGLPQDFGLVKTNSLGLQIVRTLVEEDLGGTFELFNQDGVHAVILFPRTEKGV